MTAWPRLPTLPGVSQRDLDHARGEIESKQRAVDAVNVIAHDIEDFVPGNARSTPVPLIPEILVNVPAVRDWLVNYGVAPVPGFTGLGPDGPNCLFSIDYCDNNDITTVTNLSSLPPTLDQLR